MAHNMGNDLGHTPWVSAADNCHETLSQETLDLWLISLEHPIQTDVLSEDEIRRLNRYRFAKDQRKFAVARSSLRHILARYAQVNPASLNFDYGRYGKPFLKDSKSLQFNLSHSGEYALCGVARATIGVDIEQLRSMDRVDSLIQRCLAPSEQQTLANLSASQQSTGFLEYWTCKEAYLKATGQGISESLTSIEVDLRGKPQLKIPGQSWQLRLTKPQNGYTAAIAMPPSITQIRFWRYEP